MGVSGPSIQGFIISEREADLVDFLMADEPFEKHLIDLMIKKNEN